MADRVSTEITLGGALPRAHYQTLLDIIAGEGLSTEWDGPPFDGTDIPLDGPLTLMAHEVPWGSFNALEAFCQTHGLSFERTCDPYVGGWDAQKVVFDGSGYPRSYTVSQSGDLLLSRGILRTLGLIEDIEAYCDEGAIIIPPLTIIDREDA